MPEGRSSDCESQEWTIGWFFFCPVGVVEEKNTGVENGSRWSTLQVEVSWWKRGGTERGEASGEALRGFGGIYKETNPQTIFL